MFARSVNIIAFAKMTTRRIASVEDNFARCASSMQFNKEAVKTPCTMCTAEQQHHAPVLSKNIVTASRGIMRFISTIAYSMSTARLSSLSLNEKKNEICVLWI